MAHAHEYKAVVTWTGNRGKGTVSYRAYGRDHEIAIDGKATIAGSADAAFLGDAARWNPEDMLLSSISTCHMLWFLAVAGKRKYVVENYVDEAWGIMENNEDGKLAMTRVVLCPRVTFAEAATPDAEQYRQLHHLAHDNCFIANSVKTQVDLEL